MNRQPLSRAQRVFDFHVRLASRPGAAGRLLDTLAECHIDRAVVCAGGTIDLLRLSRQLVEGGWVETDADNDAVLRTCVASGGRLVPFFFANPHRGAEPYQKCAKDFRGVEISPAVHGVRLDDGRVLELISVAAEFGHPVYVVCLERAGARVTDLVDLAARFPRVRFVLGHCGVGNIDYHGVHTIAPQPNIWLETSGGYTTVLRAALDQVGCDRVLFGTEFPLQHPRVELAKFAEVGVSAEQWWQVAWGNAIRILGEERHDADRDAVVAVG